MQRGCTANVHADQTPIARQIRPISKSPVLILECTMTFVDLVSRDHVDFPSPLCVYMNVMRGEASWVFDFEDRFNLDGGSCRQCHEANGAAGVVAVGFLAEDFVKQVGGSVDHQMLIRKVRG